MKYFYGSCCKYFLLLDGSCYEIILKFFTRLLLLLEHHAAIGSSRKGFPGCCDFPCSPRKVSDFHRRVQALSSTSGARCLFTRPVTTKGVLCLIIHSTRGPYLQMPQQGLHRHAIVVAYPSLHEHSSRGRKQGELIF